MVNEDKVQAITGEDIDINPDTICVHGDNPEAIALISQLKALFNEECAKIKPLAQ